MKLIDSTTTVLVLLLSSLMFVTYCESRDAQQISGEILCKKLTYEEKAAIYQKELNGLQLPDFAFFRKEDQEMHTQSLMSQVINPQLYPVSKPVTRNYDVKKLKSLVAEIRKESMQSAYLQPPHPHTQTEINAKTVSNRFCFNKGTLTPSGLLRMCKVCVHETVLPSDRIPQFINEIVCDSHDTHCLLGEGCCVQKIMYATFLKQTSCGNYERYAQAIRTGCECEVKPGSVFVDFLAP